MVLYIASNLHYLHCTFGVAFEVWVLRRMQPLNWDTAFMLFWQWPQHLRGRYGSLQMWYYKN